MTRGFSLEGVRVEHRPLARPRPFTLRLPLPVAADDMYASLPGRGRFATAAYAGWLEAAALSLVAANPPRFKGPVWIGLTSDPVAAIEAHAAPVLALLLREGVIGARAQIRELRLAHGAAGGAQLEIRPFCFGARP